MENERLNTNEMSCIYVEYNKLLYECKIYKDKVNLKNNDKSILSELTNNYSNIFDKDTIKIIADHISMVNGTFCDNRIKNLEVYECTMKLII